MARHELSDDEWGREIVAFANTEGGRLFVGVDDDGTIPGVLSGRTIVVLEVMPALHRPDGA